MATDKVAIDGQKLKLQVPANFGPAPPPPPAAGATKGDSVQPKVIPAVQSHHPASSAVTAPVLQTSSPVMVIAKLATPRGVSANGQPQATKPALSPSAAPGRTVMIAVPRAPSPQTVAMAPQLPANIQIPAGMMLIRSDGGQLMLVSHQALAQAQQGPRSMSGQTAKVLTPQASVAAGSKGHEKVTVIRMTAPPTFQTAPVQKTAVVKVIGVSKPAAGPTLSAVCDQARQPRLQAVVIETKKEPPATFSEVSATGATCDHEGVVTWTRSGHIKLVQVNQGIFELSGSTPASDSRSANMANNVRGLVKTLLEGQLEAEEFTQQLYQQLKSTPQPCLVPFLKKSLPAVRRLTPDPQLFVQQASTSNTPASSFKQSSAGTRQSQQVESVQPPPGCAHRPGSTTATQRHHVTKSSRPSPKRAASGKHLTGTFSVKLPFTADPSPAKDSSGSYREDDDINDVASMAGVNLREENAQILTTAVGSVVQSCQDLPFLAPNPVLSRILHTGQALGVTDVSPEVVVVLSHATQECLRVLIQKMTVMAEHRKAALKDNVCHTKVTDIRSQLRFLEEMESLKKRRKDEEERETLLRLARIRCHSDDPQQQQLKQRAKELQQIEEAQLLQREANLTALAAIGPRKKRVLDWTEGKVPLLPRQGVQRGNRVTLRDLLVCLEQDHFFRHSLTLYKAMI